MEALTQRQQVVLDAIRQWTREHGYPPTIRELGPRIGIKSLRGVTTHLETLVRKGYLSRARGARGLKILIGDAATSVESARRIPILGRVAAGAPLLAQEHVEGQLSLDPLLLGASASGAHFALKVRGDSMMQAAILDGDYVIARQQSDADNGDIVVALIGEEATVKRFARDNGAIRLQPEHPTMEPIVLNPQQSLTILGKVVAIFRKLS